MKIIEFHIGIMKTMQNLRISFKNHQNHENIRIPCDNHETMKIIKIK